MKLKTRTFPWGSTVRDDILRLPNNTFHLINAEGKSQDEKLGGNRLRRVAILPVGFL